MKYKKIKLDYDYKYLEPYIDEETMRVHYEKHHAGYEANLEKSLKNIDVSKFKTLEDLMQGYQLIEDEVARIGVRQFGGGLLNHNFLFKNVRKDVEFKDGKLKSSIQDKWGSIEKAKEEFEQAALGLFGSGWVWLVKDKAGSLRIIKTFNQDTPIFLKMTPILGIDLWEHAYYLKNRQNRKQYIEYFWKTVDWDMAEKNFSK